MIPFGTGNTDNNPNIDNGIADQGAILIYDASRKFWEGSNTIKVSSTATTFYNDAGVINDNGFSGGGSQLTDLNATNITSGTLDNNRLPTAPSFTQVQFSDLGSTDYAKFFTDGSSDTTHRLLLDLGDDSNPADFVIRRVVGSIPTDLFNLNGESGNLEVSSLRISSASNDIAYNGTTNRIESLDKWTIGGVSSLPPSGSSVVPLVGKPADSTDVMLLYESGGTAVFQVAETFTKCFQPFISEPTATTLDPISITQADSHNTADFYKGLKISSTKDFQQDWRHYVDSASSVSFAKWNYNGTDKMDLSSAGSLTITGTYSGNGSDLTSLNADQLTTGTVPIAQIPDLSAAKVTSGTLDTARIPSLASSKITSGTLDTARIPDLSASKITSGTLDNARLPIAPSFTQVQFNDLTSSDYAKFFTDGSTESTHRLLLDLGNDSDPADFTIRKVVGSTASELFTVNGETGNITVGGYVKASANGFKIDGGSGQDGTWTFSSTTHTFNLVLSAEKVTATDRISMPVRSTFPTSPAKGDMFYMDVFGTGTEGLYVYNASGWTKID
jgi:hypothetical protein